MKSLAIRSFDTFALAALLVLGAATVLAFTMMPRMASAAPVTFTSATSTVTAHAYTNTGFATTTRAGIGDTVRFQLNLGATPWQAPQINIYGMGTTTMSGSAGKWTYSTTSASAWTTGTVNFYMSWGGTAAGNAGTATTTKSQADLTLPRVTFDKTGPSLSTVSWTDVDGSTEFSATDTLTLTFSETMATSTITTGNADTSLGLSGSHTFGTSPTVSWNTAGTVLTLTLGTSPTLATADTVNPASTVKDAVGNTDASSAVTITDNVAPGAPTGVADTSYNTTTRNITIASVGSSQIRYTTDGTTPTCSTGTVYSSAITISTTVTVKAVGCDVAGNASTVVTGVYTRHNSGSSGGSSGHGGGGGSSSGSTPAVPATHIEGCIPGNAFNTMTGKSCTVPATPATGCGSGTLFSTTTGKACGSATSTPNHGMSSAVHAFQANLTTGSLGDEVKALQMFLNSHGFTIAASGPGSAGNETNMFGALTKAALAKYQAAKGITPAAGFFGPLTRAAVNAGN